MGIEDWWGSALGIFAKSPYVLLDKLRGLTIGIDLAILQNRFSASDVDKLAMTASPPHPAPDIFLSTKAIHEQFASVFNPVYVFDGMPPKLKDACRAKRQH